MQALEQETIQVVDDAKWPLVFVRYPAVVTDQCVKDTLTKMMELLNRGRTAFVFEHAKDSRLNSTQRKYFVDFLAARAPIVRARFVCAAMINVSAITRGVITAMSWVRKPDFPLSFHDSMESAVAKCREMLG